ncbi:MAG: hypothetical protein IKF47_00145 [Bacilli bacterium]|nr:hypothetical protein [Bacilli bacterium]
MNNNEVRQISDEEIRKELTKEQLQQTQVLNFQEVQKTIHFEKVTSKKPAILIAVIGLISILFGGSLQIATSLNAKPQNVQKREVKQNVIEKNLSCIKTTLDNPDGTNTIYSITYKFEDDRLVGFTKLYNISATAGKEVGKKSIEKYIDEYKVLLNETPGYDIDISSTSNTTIAIKVIVDYKKLDLTKLNALQQTKEFTKIDYNKNTSYKTIRSDSIEKGFTVE